jgi:hypothetical protein
MGGELLRTHLFNAGENVIVPKGTPTAPGRMVLRNINWGPMTGYNFLCPELGSQANGYLTNDVILLQRPVSNGAGGSNFLTVDQTEPLQVSRLLTTQGSTDHTQKRDDKAWKFTNSKEMVFDIGAETLGSPNGVDIPSAKGYQMPVADNNGNTAVINPIATLGDFEKILTIGSKWFSATDPNAITHYVGLASKEGGVRTDIESVPELLGYVGFIYRYYYDPTTGETPYPLPGRININTASREVIRAAIPPRTDFVKTGEDAQKFADDLAGLIARTGQAKPFTSIVDLISPTGPEPGVVALLTKWKTDTADNVGDPSMTDDIEERDWILSRLSNIFTVRSDTFTAYIAVRIGAPRVVPNTDPAKRIVDVDADRRFIAIFDRSAVARPDEAPRLIALHPVPDAR